MASATERAKSKLFLSNSLFAEDELEGKLEKCRKIVEDLIKDMSEKQAHDALSAAVSKSSQLHEEVCLGLFHVILTETSTAQNAYRDLNLVARDSMLIVVNKMLQVIAEKYIRLLDGVKVQLLWLAAQFLQSNIGGADAICHALLKQAAGGDLSTTNIWLADSLLGLLTKNRQWLEKYPLLLATTVYSFLRLIEDHSAGAYKSLRQREVNFSVSLLRERFADCMQIGRDLIRLLQNVSKIPEVKLLWKDMLHKPQSLCPQFTGIPHLLNIRTSRKFLGSRLTPDMENKIGFLTSKVKFGLQKRHQEWFQKQYLTLPESQSLRADLIRYICGVVHPSNEILASDITPRWAVIGWLLSTCPNNVTAVNSKLALFYDWLFYQVDIDNVMNIEPGILVMYHSLRSHFQITTSLLDFLCRISLEYYPQEQSSRECVRNAFKTVLEKKVIASLLPIIEHPRMGQELKTLVRTTFPEFYHMNGSSCKLPEEPPPGKIDSFGTNSASSSIPGFGGGQDGISDSDSGEGTNDAKFSDTDEEMDAHVNGEKAIGKVKDSKFRPIAPEKSMVDKEEDEDDDGDMVDFEELEKLDEDLRDLVLKLQQESNMGARCDTMESIIALVVSLSDFDDEMNTALATCLNISMVEDYFRPCLPNKVTDREVEDSLESPLYTLLGKLIHLPVHDIGREIIMKLLQEMRDREPKLGYHLLYYLKANDEENLTVYEEFVKGMKDFKSTSESLLNDMKTCQEYDPRLFFYVIPALYRTFPKSLTGNGDVLHLVVSIIDPIQLKELLHEVVLRDLVIFGEDHVDKIVKESLSWESYEQYNVWQLLCAEDPPVESYLNVLPLLKTSAHSEAISNILLLLKGAELTSDLIFSLLCMECPSSLKEKPKQLLSTCLLRYWSFDYSKELAKIICSHIEKNYLTGNRRRQPKGSNQLQPTMEQILVHLECFYEVCQFHQNLDFFKQEVVKRCLEKVKQNCTDSLQKRFHLLFSVCEEQKSRRSNNRTTKVAATHMAEEESSSGSGEEEEEPKKRPPKRKRKTSPDFDSDSDE